MLIPIKACDFRPDLTEEGHSRCTYDIEHEAGVTSLTITHTIAREAARLIDAVSGVAAARLFPSPPPVERAG